VKNLVRIWVEFGKKMVPRNQGVKKGHFWPVFWSYQQVLAPISHRPRNFGTVFDNIHIYNTPQHHLKSLISLKSLLRLKSHPQQLPPQQYSLHSRIFSYLCSRFGRRKRRAKTLHHHSKQPVRRQKGTM
jgi:hypothetical protein